MKRAKQMRGKLRWLTFFHRTHDAAATAILAEGFRDGRPVHFRGCSGVWLSNYPLDCNEGAKGDYLLRVHMLIDPQKVDRFEVIEHGKPYRDWLIPASFVNTRAASIERDDEDDDHAP